MTRSTMVFQNATTLSYQRGLPIEIRLPVMPTVVVLMR